VTREVPSCRLSRSAASAPTSPAVVTRTIAYLSRRVDKWITRLTMTDSDWVFKLRKRVALLA
jgi:hypothetical protein